MILCKIVFEIKYEKKNCALDRFILHLLSQPKACGTKRDCFHFRSVRPLVFSGYMNPTENYLGAVW